MFWVVLDIFLLVLWYGIELIYLSLFVVCYSNDVWKIGDIKDR